jgi:hypothetical protein
VCIVKEGASANDFPYSYLSSFVQWCKLGGNSRDGCGRITRRVLMYGGLRLLETVEGVLDVARHGNVDDPSPTCFFYRVQFSESVNNMFGICSPQLLDAKIGRNVYNLLDIVRVVGSRLLLTCK